MSTPSWPLPHWSPSPSRRRQLRPLLSRQPPLCSIAAGASRRRPSKRPLRTPRRSSCWARAIRWRSQSITAGSWTARWSATKTVNPEGGVMEHCRAVGQRPRIPSDSRHLLGLGQAFVRRGKQMSGRTHGEPRATSLLMESPPAQTPALFVVSMLATVALDPRPLLQTTVCERLIRLENLPPLGAGWSPGNRSSPCGASVQRYARD